MAATHAGEAAITATFGMTLETWGYFENLSEREFVKIKTVSDNDGEIKAVSWYGKEYAITGEYVFRTATGAPEASVGAGTTVTVQDVEANSGAIYIHSSENILVAGTDPDYKRIRFEGTWYPNLGS